MHIPSEAADHLLAAARQIYVGGELHAIAHGAAEVVEEADGVEGLGNSIHSVLTLAQLQLAYQSFQCHILHHRVMRYQLVLPTLAAITLRVLCRSIAPQHSHILLG